MFANCSVCEFLFYGYPCSKKIKTCLYSARKNMEIGPLMTEKPVYVSCKFEMYLFKNALVISEIVHTCIAFLYVLSIFTNLG